MAYKRSILPVLGVLAGLVAPHALIAPNALMAAQAQTAQRAQSESGKIDQLSDEIKAREAKKKALQSEAEALKAQQQSLRRRIIALARDLQNIDADRDRLEERLSELAVIENRLDEDLQRDRAALSRLLAGMQTMQTQPAPAFAVHADDALTAVQGALVMTAVVPTVQMRAGDLRDRLTELAAIRQRMDKQSADLVAAGNRRGDGPARPAKRFGSQGPSRDKSPRGGRTRSRHHCQAGARSPQFARPGQQIARPPTFTRPCRRKARLAKPAGCCPCR